MSIIHRYLMQRIMRTLALMLLGIFVPVLLLSLFNHLPRTAVFSGLIWPALAGIAPMIFYISLPAIVGVAIIVSYGQFHTEGTLAIVYNAGISRASVMFPALGVAVGAVLLGYVMSCYLAPKGATYLQDVLHMVQRQPPPWLLEPNRIYVLDDGRREIRFRERIDQSRIGDVYFRETTEKEEEHRFVARLAIFEARGKESWVILHDGVVQTQKPGEKESVASFNRLARPTGLAGTDPPARNWMGYSEFGPADFLFARPNVHESTLDAKRWSIEAVKRLGIPSLSLSHTLLGLALLMLLSTEYRRTRNVIMAAVCCAVVFALHLLAVLAVEQAIFQELAFVWAIAILIVAEFLFAGALFLFVIESKFTRIAPDVRAGSIDHDSH